MRPAEEVYITVVVVRRPAGAGGREPDPNGVAQSILQSLMDQPHQVWGRPPRRTAPAAPAVKGPPRRWLLLTLAITCWAGSLVSFYMLWK